MLFIFKPHLKFRYCEKAIKFEKIYVPHFLKLLKGQLISKADLRAVDSPKKRTNALVFFDMKSKKATKTNSFVRFLGESAASQSVFDFI